MQKKILLLINPISGIGGPLGLKGSDEFPVKELNIFMGPGFKKGCVFLRKLSALLKNEKDILFLTPAGYMGSLAFEESELNYEIVCNPEYPSTRQDTIYCIKKALEKQPELAIIVGGDGTIYDASSIIGTRIPIVGIPAGTKIYSSVFTKSIQSGIWLIQDYLNGDYRETPGEIILVNEKELCNNDKYVVQERVIVKTIESKRNKYHQLTKDFQLSSTDEDNIKEIAEYVIEEIINRKKLLILGPGHTVGAIAELLGFKKPLLSISLWHNDKTICIDCDSNTIYKYLVKTDKNNVLLILSPLGDSGYILGRGNQQLTNLILQMLDKKNLLLIATRKKMHRLKRLYVDTGDPVLNKRFTGYARVVVGYNEEKIIKIESA